jgi:hypothetical protein
MKLECRVAPGIALTEHGLNFEGRADQTGKSKKSNRENNDCHPTL